jgi:uncharacterized protein
MPNPIVHWELNADDAKGAQDFYSKLFDWHVDASNPMGYGLVDSHTENGINGGIHHAAEMPKGVTIYVEVDDLQGYLDKAVGMGGKVVMPVTVIPNMVTMAQFADPQGNVVGLVKSEQK